MLELKGKYNKAKVFTNDIDIGAISQIINLCNQEFIKDSKIRIMPDVHAGAGCTIGTTMTIQDKVVPNLVGVDIGCGMAVSCIDKMEIDLMDLDEFIINNIPSGHNILDNEIEFNLINELKCLGSINKNRALRSIGTLGGGNHFIEIGIDEESMYVIIHSGSRYLGKQIAEYYQNLAYTTLTDNRNEIKNLVKKLKDSDRNNDIQKEINRFKENKEMGFSKDLAYLEGSNMECYLHDMNIAQKYAWTNRESMLNVILKYLKKKYNITIKDSFQTVHNYIDIENRILRKGAISAKNNEVVIIPINMRDGSIIAKGKGNEDWNYSAPHGAGRLFSRSKAKENITLDEFKDSMKGIYSSSIDESTIDESAFAYKSIDSILSNVNDTIDILSIVKPIYNFKACSR